MITLIGIGMGREGLSLEAKKCIDEADVLIGAPRMLDFPSKAKKIHAIKAQEILDILEKEEGKRVVLFSGDLGFYSGATKLMEELKDYQIFPGLSSPSYFAAKLSMPWQDFHLVSAHGREVNILGEVLSHKKTFFLTGGDYGVKEILDTLLKADLDPLCYVGERLSYPEERILKGRVSELIHESFHSLAVLLVEHENNSKKYVKDQDFIRGEVPMTKESLRNIIVQKIGPMPGDVIFDLGSGTGSIGIALALLEPKAKVFGTEYKEEAFSLSQKNRLALGAYNLSLYQGRSEELLEDLPIPTKVFVGGSTGGLKEVLQKLKEHPFYFLMSAISLESLEEGRRLLGEMGFEDIAITQVAITNTIKRGKFTMLSAENPIFLLEANNA